MPTSATGSQLAQLNSSSDQNQKSSQQQIYYNQNQQKRSDINMDAFNAYYNNQGEGQTAPTAQPGQEVAPAQDGANPIINNIMHINHSGANINITTGQNCMNNFIFNHTAPINLNFYKDKDGN